MKCSLPFAVLLALAVLPCCGAAPTRAPNPPADGFDLAGSDARALELADEVMEALGGRPAWDATRVIRWTFFGRRRLTWDKLTGDVRVEYLGQDDDGLAVAVNVGTGEGRAWKGGLEYSRPEQRAELLQAASRHWINDSYWLVMPYKLKDSGVTLTYAGERELEGQPVEVLGLTFAGVGVTPHNRYEVLVDPVSHLVVGWSFFEQAADAEPRLSTPWTGWQRYGAIQLSGGRGEREITDIAVLRSPPAGMMDAPSLR